MKRYAPIFLAVMLCSCAGLTRPSEEPPAMKANAIRDAILLDKGKIWKDPESIRDAMNGPAYSCGRRFGAGASCLCVQANAKNSYGGYTGQKQLAVAYKDGVFVGAADSDFDDACNSFYSFAELNGDYVPVDKRPITPPKKRTTKTAPKSVN